MIGPVQRRRSAASKRPMQLLLMCFEDVSSYENRTKSGAIKAMLRESWGCGHLPNFVCNSYAGLSLFIGHALRNMISAAFSFNTAFLQF